RGVAVSNEVNTLPPRQYPLGDTTELKRLQGTIGSLPVPAKANTNYRNTGNPEVARPSRGVKQYSSRGLTLNYPDNWQVFQSQQSSEVTIAARDGIVDTTGKAEIAYGAIIGGAQRRNGAGVERDTKPYLQQLTQSNKSMSRSNKAPRRFTVSGAPALLNTFYISSA